MNEKILMAILLVVLILVLVLIIRNTFVSQVRKPLIIFAYVLSGALVAIIIYKMPAIWEFIKNFLNSQGFNL